jgi:DNA-binding winged helix-turn-helix (wHTH) protein/Tol biopolymer transport system component
MPSAYRFGDYLLDVQRHTLHRGDDEINVGERAFGVLRLLVEKAGSVVGRTELIETVWRDVIVSDDSLARAVSDLRTALADDPAQPRYVRTIHRQGYLFVAPVTAVEDELPEPAGEPVRSGLRLGNPLLLTLLFILVAILLFTIRGVMRGPARDDGARQPDYASWRLRALGPLPFAATALKPAFAKSNNMLSVVAPDPSTGGHGLFLLRPDGGEPLQLTQGIEVRGPSPEFTADDSHIIFTTYGSDPERGMVPDVWLAPVPAGEPMLLVKNASAASESPDGRDLVYSAVSPGGTSIRVRHQDGGDMEIAPRGFWPRWSPDGEWIAYTTSDPEGGGGTIHVVSPDGSEDRELTTTVAQIYGLCWTPDSSQIIYAGEQSGPTMLWSVDVMGKSQRAVTMGPGVCTSPTMSSDGRRLVFNFSHRRWYLYLAAEPGTEPRRILVDPGMQAVALSPDGTRVAIVLGIEAQSPAVSLLDLRTMERRTLSGMAATEVAWMPGGEELLVAAPAPDGIRSWIWQVPVGGGLPHPVIKGEARWRAPQPSPAGGTVAAVRRSVAGDKLVLHDLDSGEQRILAAQGTIEAPRWSPDGSMLAWSGGFRPEDLDSVGLWVCPVVDGAPRRLTMDGAWPDWETNGEYLLYGRYLENQGLWRVPLSGGAPERVLTQVGEMADHYLHRIDTGRNGAPLLLFYYEYTGALYALEPPSE